MTQAFNLGLLANNVNSSGKLDSSVGLVNATPVANGGTNLTTLGASGNMLIATSASAVSAVEIPSFGFKNRLINGAMTIAQYGTSTALAAGSSNGFAADRFRGFNVGAGAYSIIQATNVPSSANGFINSLQVDVTTADTSIAAGDLYMIRQGIEGLNITDLAWGTANAKTITLSFWVSSSKTGTHFVAFKNSAQDRCYAASYTISVADTWEFKTITVAGDQSGTWLTSNLAGIQVTWALAIGSTFQTATANVWAAGDGYATSAQVNVMDSTANNFYITGVQLEKGSIATSFDYRPYGTELGLCQRYFEQVGDVVGGTIPQSLFADSYSSGGSTAQFNWFYRQQKRATPTIAVYGTFSTSNVSGPINSAGISAITTCLYVNPAAAGRLYFYNNAASGYSASAEL